MSLTGWPYDMPDWERARRAALRRDGRRCVCCGIAGRLDVHHVQPVYSRGAPFAVANLASVCRSCHRWIHHELDGLGADGRQDRHACEAAVARVREYRRAQPQLPLARHPASTDPPTRPMPDTDYRARRRGSRRRRARRWEFYCPDWLLRPLMVLWYGFVCVALLAGALRALGIMD